MGRSERVLILRALGLGDLLTAFPALRALRQQYRDFTIELATRPDLARLARASEAVDRVIPCRGLDGVLPPDVCGSAVAVNLHGSGPESTRLVAATRPRRLLSHRHEAVPASWDGPPWCEDQHEVRRWCSMLEWFGIEADETDLALVPPGPPVEREPDLTVIHPGAADGARRWPPERFAAVALAEKCGGRRVAVTGSADERSLTRRVVAQAGLTPASNLAGTLDVIGLSRLVARAGVVVCGDTGLAHLATATATPSVVLFGPVDPARWGPPPVDRHRPLWAGRCGDPHGALPFEGLLALEVREVLHAIDEARAATPES